MFVVFVVFFCCLFVFTLYSAGTRHGNLLPAGCRYSIRRYSCYIHLKDHAQYDLHVSTVLFKIDNYHVLGRSSVWACRRLYKNGIFSDAMDAIDAKLCMII